MVCTWNNFYKCYCCRVVAECNCMYGLTLKNLKILLKYYRMVKLLQLLMCLFLILGSSGAMIKLIANFFRLTSRPQWALYQYHVDYNPEMEARRLRSGLLFQHEDLIGKTHAFDGSILFLPKRLPNKVWYENTVLLFFWLVFCEVSCFLLDWLNLKNRCLRSNI